MWCDTYLGAQSEVWWQSRKKQEVPSSRSTRSTTRSRRASFNEHSWRSFGGFYTQKNLKDVVAKLGIAWPTASVALARGKQCEGRETARWLLLYPERLPLWCGCSCWPAGVCVEGKVEAAAGKAQGGWTERDMNDAKREPVERVYKHCSG